MPVWLMSSAVQLLGRALKKLPRKDVFVTTKVRLPSPDVIKTPGPLPSSKRCLSLC